MPATSGVRFRDLGRRGVLLHVQPVFAGHVGVFVDVDGRCVFGQVGVVGAIAGDPFALAPGLEPLEVLAQAVGHHLRAVAEGHGLTLWLGVGLNSLADQ